jgi:TorA maturation chaperone TorD
MMPLPESTCTSGLDEETARSELYGLLALLYYAAPASELIAKMRLSATGTAVGAFLEEPWRVLVGMACELSDAQIVAEYDVLFGGVGKPEVYLYGSHYLSGFLNEKPLARLRTDLERLGLTRDEAVSETEDHIACLCEVMRYLIAGEDRAAANLKQQKLFFSIHIQTWLMLLCDALEQHPKARFYAAVACLTRAFVSVEMQGFEMLE